MSTYWYFECRSHTPPLRSDGEFTQHTDDDAFRWALAVATQRPIDDSWREADLEYFERNATAFLAEHPACDLAIVSEYGERRDLTAPSPQETSMSPTPIDLDAIRERRAKAERWFHGVHYGLRLYAESSADVPALLDEVDRLYAAIRAHADDLAEYAADLRPEKLPMSPRKLSEALRSLLPLHERH